MAYVVKWKTGGDNPYLIDAGPPENSTGTWGTRELARRFADRADAEAHIRNNRGEEWLDFGRVRFVRLVARRAAS